MTKTIDEQFERLASAQERSAAALEGILEAVTGLKLEQVGSTPTPTPAASTSTPEGNAGTNDPEPAEEAPVEEAEEATKETLESEPEPVEAPGEDSDPLGDGDGDAYVLPEKMTNDTLRGLARDLMEQEGKSAVFEALAEVGPGYKAVGEVQKDDLPEGHKKMMERLRG